MTPGAIRSALTRVGKAAARLRRRPAATTVELLAEWLERWRAADSAWRRELAEALPAATGFTAETVRAGLERALAPLSGEALRALFERELGGASALERGEVSGFETTAVVLAGALPPPTFLALLPPLALRSGVLVKPSAHDPLTASRLARSLAELDAELGDCVEVVAFPGSDAACLDALCEAACVGASGSDATIAELGRRVRPPRRFVGSGHRLSLAVVGPEASRGAPLEAAAGGLAVDVALWDQLGCLSPVAVYALGDPGAADRVSDALASALERLERRWPRGTLGVAEASAIAREREEAGFRAAGGRPVRVLAGAGTSWTVVREADATPRPAPLHRFVRVHPCPDASALLAALAPFGPRLAGVALAGGPEAIDLARRLLELGASRVCAPGRLQAPPLAWPRDNRPVLLPYAATGLNELI